MYLAIKPFFVLIFTIGSFAIFGLFTRKLLRIIQTVEKKGPEISNFPARIYAVITDVLLQGQVRQKPVVGVAHTLIFWGFLVITVGTIEMIIEGLFHGFNIGLISPSFYTYYLGLADIMTVGVLIGVAFGFYRRLILKPRYLTNGLDAKLILVFTALLMFSLFGLNAFKIALDPENDFYQYLFFSRFFTESLNLTNLSPLSQYIGQEVFYWLHVGLVLGFLVYIPNSKHLHVLAAAPNIFLRHLSLEKSIEKTDLEDENAESFGLGKPHELSWKNVLDLYACTECGRCEEVCPADNTGKPLSPKKLIHDFKVELLNQTKPLFAGKKEDQIPFVREDSPITPEVIWSCTACRACESACPVDIEQTNLIFEARKNLVLMEAKFPKELQTPFKNLENNFTPWAFGHDTRADWCKELNIQTMAENPDADVLFWVGCAGSFDDRAKKVSTSVVKLLQKASINFAILGTEEKCTGDPARRSGNEYLAQMLIQENVETLNKYKPKTIIASCPHCFNSLKNEYPQFGARFDVIHHTEYLQGLIDQGKLKPNLNLNKTESNNTNSTVTYHDSCYLTRWNSVIDNPRAILASIQSEVKEMKRTKRKNFCCGAGGARMFMEETTPKRVNIERTKEALATGASKIATACPFCSTMITDGLKAENREDVEVKDIAELLDEATN